MRSLQFYAYHGTSKTNAQSIVQSQEMLPSEVREDHWLGKGSYFFREDYDQAKKWAEIDPRIDGDVTVIEAELLANNDKVLHLDTLGGIQALRDYVEYLQEEKGMEFLEEQKNDVRSRLLIS